MIKKILNIALALILTLASTAIADNTVLVGPERNEYVLEVSDFSVCTNEWIDWRLEIDEFVYVHVSGSESNQRLHVVVHFSWTGTATGQDTGFLWHTRGGGKDTVNFDPADLIPFREVFIENAILDPVTDGAPRMKFEARIKVRNDEDGALIVEFDQYGFRCLGR